jgi:glutamine synthetase
MQILQNVARRYGLVCLLHEKPFAGVNGSGKHNNWSMGTDGGTNLLEPGATPGENVSFLFFCAAVIKAVNKHQALLRASIASPGQDHRLGANEAPPAIISIFLGTELDKVFETIASQEGDGVTESLMLALGTPVLPPLPKHGADRNRTSPFAFTGNKFEFRALGSAMSTALPNTVINTIIAEAVDELADDLEARMEGGEDVNAAVLAVVAAAYAANRQVCFGGDNYSPEWHAEAERRGLYNLRSTPDALPWLVEPQTIEVFEKYKVFTEQYSVKLNIEAETAASIARTLLLPAATRHLAELRAAGTEPLIAETESLIVEFVETIKELERANLEHPEIEGIEHACYMRDTVFPAMEAVRAVADRLERIVADDLWPLPKYAEMLFIK